MGSVDVVASKANQSPTSNSVTYTLSAQSESSPIRTLSNIRVSVKNSVQESASTLGDLLSIQVLACDVSSTTLQCESNNSPTAIFVGEQTSVPFQMTWNQTPCNYSFTHILIDQTGGVASHTLPSFFTPQQSSLEISPTQEQDQGQYTIEITANAPHAQTQPVKQSCTIDVVIKGCVAADTTHTIFVGQQSLLSLSEEIQRQSGCVCLSVSVPQTQQIAKISQTQPCSVEFLTNDEANVGDFELQLQLQIQGGLNHVFTPAINVLVTVQPNPCTQAQYQLDSQTQTSFSSIIFRETSWEISVISDLDCGDLNIGLSRNNQELLGSMSIITAKQNKTSSAVIYTLQTIQEDYPLGTLSDIKVNIRNAYISTFVQLSDNLSLTISPCDVTQTFLRCSPSSSTTVWVGQQKTIPFTFDWDQIDCQYTYTLNAVRTVGTTSNLALPSMFELQSSSLVATPTSDSEVGEYQINVGAHVTHSPNQPNLEECVLSVNVTSCEFATFTLDTTTIQDVFVTVFSAYEWVVKVASDADYDTCGALTINVLDQNTDIYLSHNVVKQKTVSGNYQVTYQLLPSETDLPATISQLKIEVKNSHQQTYTTLQNVNLSYTIQSCDVSSTTILCSQNTPSFYVMSLDDTLVLPFTQNWQQGTCNYSYEVQAIDVQSQAQNPQPPTMLTLSQNQIQIAPNSAQHIGIHQIKILSSAPYAQAQPENSPCIFDIQIYNCYITQLNYFANDQTNLSQLSIQLFQTTQFQFTDYIQERQGGGTCSEPINYFMTAPQYVEFDEQTKIIRFQPSSTEELGQNFITVSYQVLSYIQNPPTNPSQQQILSFEVKQCEIQQLKYQQTGSQTFIGGQTSYLEFQEYIQQHATGSPCLYQIVFQVQFCSLANCTWQDLPTWIQFQSSSRTFQIAPNIQDNYGSFRLKIQATIPEIDSQPPLDPQNDQIISFQVTCSSQQLQNLVYESNVTAYKVMQILGATWQVINFKAFKNLDFAACGYSFTYSVQVFKFGSLLSDFPSFMNFDSQNMVLRIQPKDPLDIGDYTVQLVPQYENAQISIESFTSVYAEISVQSSIASFFEPGAQFMGILEPLKVRDGQTISYRLPIVECFDFEPCQYNITAQLPKYILFSRDKKELLVAPIDEANSGSINLQINMILQSIKDGKVFNEKNYTLSITVETKTLLKIEQSVNNSLQHQSFPTTQRQQGVLVPRVSKLSATGRFQIDFNRDVHIVKLDNFSVHDYVQIQIIKGDPDYSAPLEYLAFEIKAVKFRPRQLALQIQFQYPANVSIGFQLDKLNISWNGSNFTAFDGTKIDQNQKPVYLLIPRQLNQTFEKTLVTIGQAVKSSLSSLFVLNIVFSVILTISLKSMWQLLNICQIISLTGQLFQMPALADYTVNYITDVVNLNFIPLDWAKNLLDIEGNPGLAQIFDQRLIMLAIAISIMAAIVLIVHLLTKGVKSIKVQTLVEKIKTKLFFNIFLRYFVTAYLKLYINSVQLLEEQHTFSPFKSLASVLLIVALTYTPIAILSLLQHNLLRLKQLSYTQRIESLYLGLRHEALSMTYTTVFCYRRMLLAILLLVDSKSGLKLPIIYAQQLIYMSYLICVKPCQEKFQNNLELLGEMCLLFMFYMIHFFGVQVDINAQIIGSYIFCSFLALTILGHMCLLIVLTYKNIRQAFKLGRLQRIRDWKAQKQNRIKNLKKVREEMIRRRQELVVEDYTPNKKVVSEQQQQDEENLLSPIVLENNYLDQSYNQATGRSQNHLKRLFCDNQDTIRALKNDADLEVQNLNFGPEDLNNSSFSVPAPASQQPVLKKTYQDFLNESFDSRNQAQNEKEIFVQFSEQRVPAGQTVSSFGQLDCNTSRNKEIEIEDLDEPIKEQNHINNLVDNQINNNSQQSLASDLQSTNSSSQQKQISQLAAKILQMREQQRNLGISNFAHRGFLL